MIDRPDDAPVAIHHEDRRTMIHRVAAAAQLDLVGLRAKGLQGGVDVRLRAGQAGDPRVERREIDRELLRRVALRIDGDEQDVQPVSIGFELLEPVRQLEQRRRTDIGAVGEAEEHQGGLAAKVALGDLLAMLIDQLERHALGCGRRRRR